MLGAVSLSRSPLRSAVVDAARRVSADMYALVVLVAEFDRCGEWAFDGAASCAHWVAERVDVEVSTVREWLRIGHALSAVDEIARRFADERLSYSKVRALTRVAEGENQYELCAIAQRVPAGRLAVAPASRASWESTSSLVTGPSHQGHIVNSVVSMSNTSRSTWIRCPPSPSEPRGDLLAVRAGAIEVVVA